MAVDFPKIEHIINADRNKLTESQQRYYCLAAFRQDIVNSAIARFVKLDKNPSEEIFLSEFLDALYGGIYKYLTGECVNGFLLDNLVFVARAADAALCSITANPDTRLIKIDECVPHDRVTETSIKTMQWISRRPGQTIKEKISPQNKVLTVRRKFSVDTKENESTMYLYDVVYKILAARIDTCNCENCSSEACQTKSLYERMRRLYAMRTRIKQSELGAIPKVRHSVRNNKLMCDPNYKTVWDCNTELSRIENSLRKEWNALYDLTVKDLFYCILAVIKHTYDIRICDELGRIEVNENGEFDFVFSDSEVSKQRTATSGVKFIYCNGGLSEHTLSLSGSELVSVDTIFERDEYSCYCRRQSSKIKFDLSEVSGALRDYAEQDEMNYDTNPSIRENAQEKNIEEN